MPLYKRLFYSVFATGLPFMVSSAKAEPPEIVTSIAPLHSIVAQIADGRSVPSLLVPAGQSPHDFALRPSDAQALSDADVLFWIGPNLEQFLDGAMDIMSDDAVSVELVQSEGLTTYEFRSGGVWGAGHSHDHGHEADHSHNDHDHDHDHEADHSHDDHDHDHAHNHDHDHDHKDDHSHDDDHAHEAGHSHDHGDGADPHIWLDPANGQVIGARVAEVLTQMDPEGADVYAGNLDALNAELATVQAEKAAQLAEVQNRPFIVFHDAFQYFERAYSLEGVGAVTVSPEQLPGARRLTELRAVVRDRGAVCVFSEPQFSPRIVNALIEGTDVRTAVLDPLGQGIEEGPGLYPTLLRNMAEAVDSCLSP